VIKAVDMITQSNYDVQRPSTLRAPRLKYPHMKTVRTKNFFEVDQPSYEKFHLFASLKDLTTIMVWCVIGGIFFLGTRARASGVEGREEEEKSRTGRTRRSSSRRRGSEQRESGGSCRM